MRKIFLFFIAALFSVSMWADADTWTVAGDNATLFGTTWAPSNTANDMTLVDGLYTWSVTDVELSEGFNFKVCKNHSWGEAYPEGTGNYWVDLPDYAGYAAEYDITLTFNADSKVISAIVTAHEVTLYFLNTADWANVKAYVWRGTNDAYKTWSGEAMSDTGEKLYNHKLYSYTFPDIYTNVIFNNGAADQTDDETWDAASPYYSEGHWYATKEAIPDPVPATFYITGDSALVVDAGLDKSVAWNSHAIKATEDSYVLSLKAGDYQMKVVTTGGVWKSYDDLSDATKANLGITPNNDGNICFTLTAAGNVTVTYTNETFTVTGANIKPAEMKTLKIVKTRWDVTDVAAKYAVWMCDDKIRDSFTDFGVAGTNDTITVSYHSKASYCIIVRFPGNLETPSWGESDANVWNKTGLVDLDGDVYTAVSLGSNKSMTGTWDAYYPTIKLYGDFAEVGGYWAETALTGDNESVSVSLSLSGSTTYSFKLKINDVQYSKINATPYELKDNWREVGHFDLDDQGGLNVIKLITDKTGSYTFTYTYATDMLNVVFPTATAIDNTEAATKAVKRIVNGQLVIEREGKLFNALGAEVK